MDSDTSSDEGYGEVSSQTSTVAFSDSQSSHDGGIASGSDSADQSSHNSSADSHGTIDDFLGE